MLAIPPDLIGVLGSTRGGVPQKDATDSPMSLVVPPK